MGAVPERVCDAARNKVRSTAMRLGQPVVLRGWREREIDASGNGYPFVVPELRGNLSGRFRGVCALTDKVPAGRSCV
jgi:hypothetical protein